MKLNMETRNYFYSTLGDVDRCSGGKRSCQRIWSKVKRLILLMVIGAGLSVLTQPEALAQFCSGDPIPFDPAFPNDETKTQQDLRGNSEYTRGNCPANDIQILGAFLDTGDPCNTCTPGDQVTADLIITVHHNTSSGDRFLGVFGDLTETINGSSTSCDIARCSGPLL